MVGGRLTRFCFPLIKMVIYSFCLRSLSAFSEEVSLCFRFVIIRCLICKLGVLVGNILFFLNIGDFPYAAFLTLDDFAGLVLGSIDSFSPIECNRVKMLLISGFPFLDSIR